MMLPYELRNLASRYVKAQATSSEAAEPLRAALFAQQTLALNAIAWALIEAYGVAPYVVGEPEPEPVNNSPAEPEPKRNSALWQGRNGQPVDTEET